ncbi:hypothetical protein Chor_002627 [Crotalus horridus]
MGNAIKILKTTPEVKTTPWQSGQRSDFLAVLHDYPTPDISQPIFQVGEKLRVISDEGVWWKACSLTSGKEHYIPENCVARVYHGWLFEGIGREKAEELLLLPSNKTGSFMIRKSETTNGFYSLSVRHVNVKHYRIFRLPNNWYYISPRQTFQCLEDLVNHYSGKRKLQSPSFPRSEMQLVKLPWLGFLLSVRATFGHSKSVEMNALCKVMD